jgi:hypothetical protein
MSSKHAFSFRKVAAVSALSAIALATVFLSGQGQSVAAPRPAESQSAAITKGAKIDSEQYTVEMKASGTYKANQEGNVEIAITPKGDYKLNAKYPVKFKLTDPAPEGLRFPKPLLKREDGKFEDKKGSFTVPFVAARSGKATISGVLSVSVCTDKNCVMEKLELDLTVDVN